MKNYAVKWNTSPHGGYGQIEFYEAYTDALQRCRSLRSRYGWDEHIQIDLHALNEEAEQYAIQRAKQIAK